METSHPLTPAATAAAGSPLPAPTADADLPAPATEKAVVHREPVVAFDGRVVGYTIEVRMDAVDIPVQREPGQRWSNAWSDPDAVVHAAYLGLDLPNLVADRYAFVPATPAMLEGYLPEPAVPGRLVLDLPVGFELTDDAIRRAATLRGLGAVLALTDYRGEPEQEALLPHLGFVVVHPMSGDLPLAELVHHVHAAGARVLAAGVESSLVEDECRAAGVDALRGGSAPTTSHASRADAAPRVLRAGELQCLAVMHLLAQPEPDLAAVSQVIDTDPVISLRVLHLVNSGAFALAAPIDTVHQAVVLLGAREVNTLVTALMLDSRPDAMDSLWFILARALAVELLADDQAGYTVGMLSALSEQLGVPTDVVLDKVGVSDVLAAAIRSEEGPLGATLAAIRAHERRDDAGVLAAGMQPADVSAAYVRCLTDALATARTVTREPGF